MRKPKQRLLLIHNKLVPLELLLMLVFTFLLCVYTAPNSFLAELGFMAKSPLLFFLNALPVAVLLMLLYFITSNSFLSGGVTNLIFGLMNYANLLKIEGRDDPFVPADFILLREALQATGEYRLDMHVPLLALIIVSSAVMLALGVWLGRTEKRPAMPRIIGIILSVSALISSYFLLYRDKKLYSAFPVSSVYNVTSIFNELGFNYCFLYNFNLYTAEKPDGYSASAVKAYIDDFSAAEVQQGERPHILIVMCEAFSDIHDSPVFTYSEDDHPLRDYYKVISEPNSISGHIVVPNFGAGTANTEFDVLTGMQTNLISKTSNSALRSFNKDIPSAARVFLNAGYNTFFMHPGQSWFYNRDSALSHMGIDDKLFVDDLENKSNMDDVFLDNLKDALTARTASGDALFTYSTTIQNHQTYNYAKYDHDIPPVRTSVELSAEAEELLSVYTYGVKCSSEMLLELTEYLNTLDEPYILTFFGDHLPNLGADYLAYRELGLNVGYDGSPEDVLANYTVPFLIWCNDAYMADGDLAQKYAALELPADGRISACFLGEVALELAGLENTDPFFAFLGELRRSLPVIKDGIVSLPDGSVTNRLTAEQQALIDKLHCWQYYRMTQEKVRPLSN